MANELERTSAMTDNARRVTTAIAVLMTTACDAADPLVLDTPRPVEVPASAGAAEPNVTAGDGGIVLSWIEPRPDGGHALRYVRWRGDGAGAAARTGAGLAWQDTGVVASGTDWFVNWADFPSVIALSDSLLAAHWLERSGLGSYAYDVRLSRSTDGGRTWSEPVTPHADATATEHGFATLFPTSGGVGVVWLDGRRYADRADAPATNEMSVRFAVFDGGARDGVAIDTRACDCCQTDVALTSRGPLVTYRDRSEDEIRDIVVSRLESGTWTAPRKVHDDGWHITGCPVNGPQIDASGDAVVVAWYTEAQATPRVNVAFSADAGETFATPVRIDNGHPVGRADVVLLGDADALVVWLERVGETGEVRARRVRAGGELGPPVTIGATSAQRASGFPRMARSGTHVVLAWTETGEQTQVRAVTLDVGR